MVLSQSVQIIVSAIPDLLTFMVGLFKCVSWWWLDYFTNIHGQVNAPYTVLQLQQKSHGRKTVHGTYMLSISQQPHTKYNQLDLFQLVG